MSKAFLGIIARISENMVPYPDLHLRLFHVCSLVAARRLLVNTFSLCYIEDVHDLAGPDSITVEYTPPVRTCY